MRSASAALPSGPCQREGPRPECLPARGRCLPALGGAWADQRQPSSATGPGEPSRSCSLCTSCPPWTWTDSLLVQVPLLGLLLLLQVPLLSNMTCVGVLH